MTYMEFITTMNHCPVCNDSMLVDQLGNVGARIITFICSKHLLHYESYICDNDLSNFEIIGISIQMGLYSVSWMDNTKELTLREAKAEIIFQRKYENKTSMDWLLSPHKNILRKAQTLMLLK